MSIPRYGSYRESGVEWLGEVPSHWPTLPLKRLATLTTGITPPTDDEMNYAEDGFPWIRPDDIDELGRETRGSKFLSQSGRKFVREVPPFSSLVCCIGTIGKVGLIMTDAATNQQITAVSSNFHNKYIYYSLVAARAELESQATGNVLRILNTERLGRVMLPCPSRAEASAIASFLDRETVKIDTLVQEQQRLIDLLKEKRQAVISHAVTKGLDPSVPMRNSGIGWLGEVPAHWEVRSIASCSTKITNGYVGPTRDILVDEGVRYLQSLHIKNGMIVFDTPYFVAPTWSDEHGKSVLRRGDVLVVQTGDIGQTAVVGPEFEGCNCHALIIISPVHDVIMGEWLERVLRSEFGQHSLFSVQTGALHPHLNCGNVKLLRVPVPPKEEQRSIIQAIEELLRPLTDLLTDAEAAIALLQERRAALISAAVTGKIDVRGLVPTQAEAA